MAGQVKLEQTGSGHDNVWTGHVSLRSGQVRPGQSQVRSCLDRTEQVYLR